jgi:hypothetical protein
MNILNVAQIQEYFEPFLTSLQDKGVVSGPYTISLQVFRQLLSKQFNLPNTIVDGEFLRVIDALYFSITRFSLAFDSFYNCILVLPTDLLVSEKAEIRTESLPRLEFTENFQPIVKCSWEK